MWKLVFGSAQGTSHVESDMPCQDYCAGTIIGTTLVAACADGAGSAEFSHLGAKAAVDRFMQMAVDHFAKTDAGESVPTTEQVEAWVENARETLLEEATAIESTPRQLACTFLAALVGEGWAAFAQVGDGVIVFDGPTGYDLAFWPDNGEYANTTWFLSENDYQQHLHVEIVEQHISDLAVLTDGLQMLALDVAASKVHERFFTPLFETLRNGPTESELQISLLHAS
jgi:hypothetical protein